MKMKRKIFFFLSTTVKDCSLPFSTFWGVPYKIHLFTYTDNTANNHEERQISCSAETQESFETCVYDCLALWKNLQPFITFISTSPEKKKSLT